MTIARVKNDNKLGMARRMEISLGLAREHLDALEDELAMLRADLSPQRRPERVSGSLARRPWADDTENNLD